MSPNEKLYDFCPEGIRVLAVDANPICLLYLVFLLKKCKYEVVGVRGGTEALNELRGNKGKFDIVITNVEQEDIDGFKLLEIIGNEEMDIPVIMITADDNQGNVMRGIENGAIDYILKPVRIQQIKNIWQHVFRKKIKASSQKSDSTRETNEPEKTPAVCSPSSSSITSKKKKKRRVTWTPELHKKFVDAVDKLGNVVHPKKVLELMNEPGLTRDNVASHLQKFRNVSRKQIDDHSLRSNGFDSNIVRSQDEVNGAFKTSIEEMTDPLRPTKLLQFQDLDFSSYVKKVELPDEYMRHSNLGLNGYGSRATPFYAQPSVFGSNPSSQASMINDSSSETVPDICIYQNPFPAQQETQEMQEALIDATIETLTGGENSSYEKPTLLSDDSENQQPSRLQNLETSSGLGSVSLSDDDLQAIIKPFIDSETPPGI